MWEKDGVKQYSYKIEATEMEDAGRRRRRAEQPGTGPEPGLARRKAAFRKTISRFKHSARLAVGGDQAMRKGSGG